MIEPGFAHLTDDQFTDLLIGSGDPSESEAHLEVCALCQQEQHRFLVSVGDYTRATMGWSEARKAKPVVPSRAWLGFAGPARIWAPAGMVLAAVALFIGLAPIMKSHRYSTVSSGASLVTTSADSDAQIARDNALLQSVNVALASNEPSPLEEYGLAWQAAPRTARQSKAGSEARRR